MVRFTWWRMSCIDQTNGTSPTWNVDIFVTDLNSNHRDHFKHRFQEVTEYTRRFLDEEENTFLKPNNPWEIVWRISYWCDFLVMITEILFQTVKQGSLKNNGLHTWLSALARAKITLFDRVSKCMLYFFVFYLKKKTTRLVSLLVWTHPTKGRQSIISQQTFFF